MISDAAVDAYIREHTRFAHTQQIDPREHCRRCLEAAVSAEAWALKDVIAQAEYVYSTEPMALDALAYLRECLNAAAREAE